MHTMVAHHLGLRRTQRRMFCMCTRAGNGIRRAATAALGWFVDGCCWFESDDDVSFDGRWQLDMIHLWWSKYVHLPCAFDAALIFVELFRWMMYRFDGSIFCCCDGDGWCTWSVLSSMFAIFCRRGTEFLVGKEALPLALPINRYHC